MRLTRCLLVVLLASATGAAALRLLVPAAIAPGAGFESLLVRGCASVATACTAWGWLSVLAVVAEALGSAEPGAARRGVPAGLRRWVLAGCGVALTATAAPALAATGADTQEAMPAAVAGLPFPARAMDRQASAEHRVVVRRGDSLWAITARRSPGADDVEITSGWHRLYARNRAVVGDDPSLIHPGQRLVLPAELEES